MVLMVQDHMVLNMVLDHKSRPKSQKNVWPARSSDSCSGKFVWNQSPRVGWKHNKMTSLL